MKIDLLHTPEGVRDLYGRQCRNKEIIKNKLMRVCDKYGYSHIQTPAFEFFDVFNSERGSVASNEMFKFFDNTGNTLVLRPDFTPSVARCAAKYFENVNLPVKLSYNGNAIINHMKAYRGQLKENTIVGCELIGSGSIEEDLEILCVVIDELKAVNLSDFQLEIGNIAFFKGLMKEAAISQEDELALIELINKKNYIAVEEYLIGLNISKEISKIILELPSLFGDVLILEKAFRFAKNEECKMAIERLKKLYSLLKEKNLEKYVTFDLGSLSIHTYYTGIIFKAYTFKMGDAIVIGGRYDKLISQFGANKKSIGYSIVVDRLLEALVRQEIEIEKKEKNLIFAFKKEQEKLANEYVDMFRNNNKNVNAICVNEICIEELEEYAKILSYDVIYYLDDSLYEIVEGKKKLVNVLTVGSI